MANWIFEDETLGLQPIEDTSTTQNHPLGFIAQAKHAGYGSGEFIYLKGVASTAVGDAVIYESGTSSATVPGGTTVRTLAASRGCIAIAMSANVASHYGWYCISGFVPVSVNASVDAADTLSVSSTAGQLEDNTTAAQGIIGLKTLTAAGTPSAGFALAQLNRPGAFHTTNV